LPGKTTYYTRLQALLELVGSREHRSANELLQGIVRRSPPNFVFHRWDSKEEKVIARCSENAVRNTMNLAVELGLLDAELGALTAAGKEAADPARFDAVIRRRLRSYFNQMGCSVDALGTASLQLLQGKEVVLPTADELYEAVCAEQNMDLSETKFRVLLRLLSASGGIRASRREVFLPSQG